MAKLMYAMGEMAQRERIKNQEKRAKPSELSERAVIFLTDAANSNSSIAPMAQFILGSKHLKGEYLPKDLPKAVHFLEMAKASGVAQAAANLIEAKTELEHTK
jgi:TPR repeat protein